MRFCETDEVLQTKKRYNVVSLYTFLRNEHNFLNNNKIEGYYLTLPKKLVQEDTELRLKTRKQYSNVSPQHIYVRPHRRWI